MPTRRLKALRRHGARSERTAKGRSERRGRRPRGGGVSADDERHTDETPKGVEEKSRRG
jgi:hypothetical protein